MKQWCRSHAVLLSFLAVFALMLMIFCFSAQPAEESSYTSGQIVIWILHLVYPGFFKLSPAEQGKIWNILSVVVRKTAHMIEYALLGASLLLHLRKLNERIHVRKPKGLAWLIGALYALSDEFHQRFVPGRSGEPGDILLDCFGVLIGVLLLFGILTIREKRRRSIKITRSHNLHSNTGSHTAEGEEA